MAEDTPFAEAGNDKAKETKKETVRLPGENPEGAKLKETTPNLVANTSERKRLGKAVAVDESSDNSRIKKAKNKLKQTKLFKDLELVEATITEAKMMIKGGRRTKKERNKEISGSSRDDNCNCSGSA
ncbi:hypothetical protein Droror1_Dr00006302, partial [Drosera rotundifolia]